MIIPNVDQTHVVHAYLIIIAQLQLQNQWSDLHWNHNSGQGAATKQVTERIEVS